MRIASCRVMTRPMWVQNGGAPPPQDITPSLVVNSLSGVAPLVVQFDATGTTGTGTTTPFHDFEYRWSFGDPWNTGDPGTKYWSNGARPGLLEKNYAKGPVAGHVFEKPGTYTVTLTVFDGTTTATQTTNITVTDPDVVFAGKTTCISADGDFTGAPVGATLVTSSDFTASLSAAVAAGARRVLFKRGLSYSTSTYYIFNRTEPFILGAFGSGARPVVNLTASGYSVFIPNQAAKMDCRVMDLEIAGNGYSGGFMVQSMLPYPVPDARPDLTVCGGVSVIRCYAHDLSHLHTPTGHDNAVVDCEFLNCVNPSSAMPVYAQDCFRYFMAGNLLDSNSMGEYSTRYQGGTYGIISNNTFKRCGTGKTVFTLRGDQTQTAYITQYHVISDNWFDGESCAGSANVLTISPQNGTRNEQIKDVIVERNYITAAIGMASMSLICARQVTVRNNLFRNQSTGIGNFITLNWGGNTGGLPYIKDVKVFNNTFISTSTGGKSALGLIDVSSGTTVLDTIVKNNFMYAPNATTNGSNNNTGADFIFDQASGGSTILQANSTQAQTRVASPTLPTLPPDQSSDYASWGLSAGCYGINTGVPVQGIVEDFFGTLRTGTMDMGAVTY